MNPPELVTVFERLEGGAGFALGPEGQPATDREEGERVHQEPPADTTGALAHDGEAEGIGTPHHRLCEREGPPCPGVNGKGKGDSTAAMSPAGEFAGQLRRHPDRHHRRLGAQVGHGDPRSPPRHHQAAGHQRNHGNSALRQLHTADHHPRPGDRHPDRHGHASPPGEGGPSSASGGSRRRDLLFSFVELDDEVPRQQLPERRRRGDRHRSGNGTGTALTIWSSSALTSARSTITPRPSRWARVGSTSSSISSGRT